MTKQQKQLNLYVFPNFFNILKILPPQNGIIYTYFDAVFFPL